MRRVWHRIPGILASHREPTHLGGAVVTTLAKDLGDTPAQFAFRFALGEGLVALTGTKNPTHMNQDLDVVRTLNEPGRMLKADGRAAVRDLGKKLLQVSMTKRQRHKRRSRRGGHFR